MRLSQPGNRLLGVLYLRRVDLTDFVTVKVDDPLGAELCAQVTDVAAVVAERGAQVLDLAERRHDVMMDLEA